VSFDYTWTKVINIFEVPNVGGCTRFTQFSFDLDEQHTLQRKVGNNFVNVAGPILGKTFSNITTRGLYRIAVTVPVKYNQGGCPSNASLGIMPGDIVAQNSGGAFVGAGGTMSSAFFSNTFRIGPTQASDNSYYFVESGVPSPNNTFSPGEVVKINTSASSGYNLWWIAIFEAGETENGWASPGWKNGQVPNGVLELNQIWSDGNQGVFLPNHLYTVQFVVENSACLNSTDWNNLDKSFIVCNGCKPGDVEGLKLYPNPATKSVTLAGFNSDRHTGAEFVFYDVTGKVVSKQTLTDGTLDISDLPNGMYSVRGLLDQTELLTTKLVVAN
jgi:Secretion system C-terminal sorting domain